MIAVFEKSVLSGKVKAPPSKSMAHRHLICAALSDDESIVKGIDLSEDILATIDCLNALGAEITVKEDQAFVKGIDFEKFNNDILNSRESGSTLRFLIPIALLSGKKITFNGYGRLMERPLEIYESLAKENNWIFERKENSLTVCGNLKSGEYILKGDISSQFITGLLFVLPKLKNDSTIKILPPFESKSYIYLTLYALSKFGIEIDYDGDLSFKIKGNQKYKPCSEFVEGDYSNAAFLDVFNYLDGSVFVDGLDENSMQGDKVYKEYFESLLNGTPELDISDCPDLGPVLIALATLKNGAILKGTKRLAVKESDRGKVMQEELSKLGADVKCYDNEIVIKKANLSPSTETLNGHNDHRIVMALSTVLTVVGGSLSKIEAVKKSFPKYFDIIKILNAKVTLK